MKQSAHLSDCGTYRFKLERTWDPAGTKVLFIMLNPSTADADQDDPTIRRCIGYAKAWGHGGLLVGNLFPYRATDPRQLLTAEEPWTLTNQVYLGQMAKEAAMVVCAWGNGPLVDRVIARTMHRHGVERYKPLSNLDMPLHYLAYCNDGTPKHPLYLKADLVPQRIGVTGF